MARTTVEIRCNVLVSCALGAALAAGCGGPVGQFPEQPPLLDAHAQNPAQTVVTTPTREPAIVGDPAASQDTLSALVPTSVGTPSAQEPVPTELLAGIARRGGKVTNWAVWLNSQRAADERCGRREVGSCVVYDCRGSTAPYGVTGPDVGEIALTGGAAGALLLRPDADGRYAPVVQTNEATWAPGDSVHMVALGGPGAPPFSTELNLLGALDLSVPSADLPEGESLALDRDAPLELRWGQVQGDVGVVIRETDSTDTPGLDDLTVSCTFAGGQGLGVVPAAALESLSPATSVALPHTVLQVGRRMTARVNAGTLPVTVSLLNAVEVPLAVHGP